MPSFDVVSEFDAHEASNAIDQANVWLGAEETVEMVLSSDVELLLPLGRLDQVTAHYTYTDPVEAPITAGQKLGELVVLIPDTKPMSFPLIALTSVESGGFVERVFAAAEILLRRVRTATSGELARQKVYS